MEPSNLLLICSDQHNRAKTGCYGDIYARTPNIDRLADKGTLFENAYCLSPLCMPSRAGMVTGRYVHQLGCWENCHGYRGQAPSFAHLLEANGVEVTTIGKLHFQSSEADTGFVRQQIPLHAKDGVGSPSQCLRTSELIAPKMHSIIENAGPGDNKYFPYDSEIARRSAEFLRQKARAPSGKPWVLYCGFVHPHPPWKAPRECFDHFSHLDVPMPVDYGAAKRPRHPVLESMRASCGLGDEFSEDAVRRAIRTYYALCEFLDGQIGIILRALEESGLSDSTRVIYMSDHGDTLGDHGLWFKQTMYDGSAAVPFVIRGPGVPAGQRIRENVSLIDLYATVADCVGVEVTDPVVKKQSSSLLRIAERTEAPSDVAFSEFHAGGAPNAVYMLKKGRYKLVYYTGCDSQLFDLEADPEERRDLFCVPEYSGVLEELTQRLRSVCDPEDVDCRCKRDQDITLESFGGRENVRKNFLWTEVGSPPPAIS